MAHLCHVSITKRHNYIEMYIVHDQVSQNLIFISCVISNDIVLLWHVIIHNYIGIYIENYHVSQNLIPYWTLSFIIHLVIWPNLPQSVPSLFHYNCTHVRTGKPSGLWAKLFVITILWPCLSFTMSFIMSFIPLNCDLLSFIIAWKRS